MNRLQRLAALFSTTVLLVHAFNFDVANPSIASGRAGSYFGYSVAVHENNNALSLLVGAPQDRDSVSNNLTGTAYQCQKNGKAFSCNKANIIQSYQNEDTGQWLGATVVSNKGNALVCAPRTGEKVKGQCYFGKGALTSFDKYLSFSDSMMNGVNFCEIGFSASISSDGSQFFTGGPSCDLNKGHLFGPKAPLDSLLNYYDDGHIDIAYFTYAMASGKVLNGREGLVVSVGFHQSSQFAGKVLVLNPIPATALEVRTTLVGYQSGESFGASLAVSDLNNDGRDDIVVGAPFHTEYTNAEVRFELGAVYVYYQTAQGAFQRGEYNELVLKGKTTGGRFGYAVAALADTNADGYNDVAVGAPYEDAAGTVYIYHGSKVGLRSEPGQVISGSSFSPPVSSFGFSFSAGDVDANRYSDLIVGAYMSDKVVYLPARPVVRVTSDIAFDPEYITMEKTDCPITYAGRLTQVPCAKMTYCLHYTGLGVPSASNFNVTIVLDAKQPKSNRLLLLSTSEPRLNQVVSLIANVRFCQEQYVYVKPDIRDKLTPMEVSLTASLVETVPRPLLPPIQDQYEGNGDASALLSIFKNCGPDKICVPDLQLEATLSTESYVQGSGERLLVDVTIANAGEDAFGSEFYLHLPASLSFINTDSSVTNASVSCYPPGEVNGPALRCEVGNPLPATKAVRVRVVLQPNPSSTGDRSISFLAEVNSTNSEGSGANLIDNKKMLTLNYQANVVLQLTGWSRPESLAVNATALQQEGAVLPTYAQFYELRNMGPSEVLGATLSIAWPTQTAEGFDITELTAQPSVTEGSLPADCDPVNLDSKNIAINCRTNRLMRNERVVIRLSARLATEALFTQLNRDSFTVTSSASANATELPFGQALSTVPPSKTQLTITITKMKGELTLLQATPWWIPVASAVGAVAILATIVAVLHRYGFFQRNRPQEMTASLQPQESQPLQEQRPVSEVDHTVDEDSA